MRSIPTTIQETGRPLARAVLASILAVVVAGCDTFFLGDDRAAMQLARLATEAGDPALATEYIEQAYALGRDDLAFRLGNVYRAGRDVPVDVEKSEAFFGEFLDTYYSEDWRSLEARRIGQLGTIIANGWADRPIDPSIGIEMMEHAARANDPASINRLANFYRDQRDFAAAAIWFMRAAQDGNLSASFEMARLARDYPEAAAELGTPPQVFAQAEASLLREADSGDENGAAHWLLHRLYDDERFSGANEALSAQYLDRAAALGHPGALMKQGNRLRAAGSLEEATAAYIMAFDLGAHHAAARLLDLEKAGTLSLPADRSIDEFRQKFRAYLDAEVRFGTSSARESAQRQIERYF